jgi:Lipopolysaccharide kinase (Kdo/WaaP) family
MKPMGYDATDRGGWSLFTHREALGDGAARDCALQLALDAARGCAIRRVRRSRHGETWFGRLGDAGSDVFIKVLAPARGIDAIKCAIRGSHALHVAAISDQLALAGIGVPRVILYGRENRGGREVVITERAPGQMVPRWLKGGREQLAFKRALLRTLGAQIAKLHRAGFIHGDLTPFNVVVAGDREPPRISFIDHERTRRTCLARFARPRLRNLVQLGRFDLPGLATTDRMRVWSAYARAMGVGDPRAERNRIARMLRERVARDATSVAAHPPMRAPQPHAREGS